MLGEEIITVYQDKYTEYILYVCITGEDKSPTLLHFIVDLHMVITGLRAIKIGNND